MSQVKTQLGNYAKTWVGNNEEYITLTWNYIEYLKTVQHSSYGTGMAAIYDGLTFEKYPWEHMGIGDRQNYRAYDMIMIAKSLFMINLYAAYGGLSDIQKGGLYNNYNNCKPTLKEFCEFKVSNPDKFRVCQIPGAHFIMHKEIQYYDYKGNNNEAPDLNKYGKEVCYRPEWHKAGKIKIENPKELLSKLIYKKEAEAIIARAQKEAQLEKQRVGEEVKQEMINIASLMAQKVVAGRIDTTVQKSLVEETLKEIGNDTWQS